ncbi:hypothetical protein QZH41_018219 [Actinostola sp. cb2023]|nr:hypothetical protein QZH41_018219 [Actinostola sp. cb2023]
MARFLRLSSQIVGRRIHTSVLRKFDPVPTVRGEFGSDLQALKQKETGPWSALTMEEKVALYRSQFPKTLVEARIGEPYVKKLIGGVSILIAVALGLFAFLRAYRLMAQAIGNFPVATFIKTLDIKEAAFSIFDVYD